MAGSTNFLQWNPGALNQQSDATYAADSLRSGGATLNAIFGSPLANKLFYQQSIFTAAFAQVLANKGYVVSDASYVNLQTVLANVITQADLPTLVGVPLILARSHIDIVHTGTTTEDTVYEITIPALAVNSTLRVRVGINFSVQGAGISLAKVLWAGNLFALASQSGGPGNAIIDFYIGNRNVLNTQIILVNFVTNGVIGPQNIFPGGIDTSVPTQFNLRMQSANNTDSQTFKFIEFDLVR